MELRLDQSRQNFQTTTFLHFKLLVLLDLGIFLNSWVFHCWMPSTNLSFVITRPGPGLRLLLEHSQMRISNGLSCTKDVIRGVSNHIGLTKNGLDAVKVPEEALVSETADDAVKLNNNRKEQSEKGASILKANLQHVYELGTSKPNW